MKRVGRKIYDSRKWRRLRQAYLESRNYICERCGGVATIAHHKEYLTAENLGDAKVSYNTANLEALCQTCHNLEHDHFSKSGAIFGANGDVVGVVETKQVRNFKAAQAAIEKL